MKNILIIIVIIFYPMVGLTQLDTGYYAQDEGGISACGLDIYSDSRFEIWYDDPTKKGLNISVGRGKYVLKQDTLSLFFDDVEKPKVEIKKIVHSMSNLRRFNFEILDILSLDHIYGIEVLIKDTANKEFKFQYMNDGITYIDLPKETKVSSISLLYPGYEDLIFEIEDQVSYDFKITIDTYKNRKKDYCGYFSSKDIKSFKVLKKDGKYLYLKDLILKKKIKLRTPSWGSVVK